MYIRKFENCDRLQNRLFIVVIDEQLYISLFRHEVSVNKSFSSVLHQYICKLDQKGLISKLDL